MVEPYYEDDAVTIYHGDCRDVLDDPEMEWLNSVSTVMVTDPPYGIAWSRGRNAARGSRDVEPVFLVNDWPQRRIERSGLLVSTKQSMAALATETGHPHTKPVDVLRDLISLCPPGLIIDPFMGSGSTLVAAKDCLRRAIGIEIDERYCEVAANRCAQGLLNFGGTA